MSYPITTQAALRAAFWAEYPQLACKRNRAGKTRSQNSQPVDTRMAWVDYVDQCERAGVISTALADRATL